MLTHQSLGDGRENCCERGWITKSENTRNRPSPTLGYNSLVGCTPSTNHKCARTQLVSDKATSRPSTWAEPNGPQLRHFCAGIWASSVWGPSLLATWNIEAAACCRSESIEVSRTSYGCNLGESITSSSLLPRDGKYNDAADTKGDVLKLGTRPSLMAWKNYVKLFQGDVGLNRSARSLPWVLESPG